MRRINWIVESTGKATSRTTQSASLVERATLAAKSALMLVALALPAVLTTPSFAASQEWRVVPGADGTEVVFESKAPMESFEGKTKQLDGRIALDPAALGDSIIVSVAVDLASLDTGIALRNQHMRENHLETETFPKATFTGARLAGFPSTLSAGKTVKGKAHGTFDLHGVSRPVEVEAELTLRPDGKLAVRATFEVFLEDYEIDRPKFLMLKLDEKQRITVDLLADPAS